MNKISIITPMYQGERYIVKLKTIIEKNAVVAQDEASIQWIIYNDDPTRPIQKVPSNTIDIIVVNAENNIGTQQARIRGLEKSEGEYILFLDQDDWISDNWIKSQMEHIGDADAVVCDALEDGKHFYGSVLRPSFEEALTLDFNLKKTCGFLPGQTMICRDSISDRWLNNHFTVNHCDDYYLWLCMLLEGKKIIGNPNVLYEHISTGSNQSSNRVIWHRSMVEMIAFLWKDNMINSKQKQVLEENLFRETEDCLSDRNWIIEKNQLLSKIIETYEKEYNISSRLLELGIESVAIYGVGECGYHLYKKLNSEGFKIVAFIDRRDFENMDIPVYKKENTPSNIKCVINTLIKDDNSVVDYYNSNMPDISVIHIRELIF